MQRIIAIILYAKVLFYFLGVEDSGQLMGLSAEEMSASLGTLNQMALKLGATTTVLRESVVPSNDNVTKIITEVLVRKVSDDLCMQQ